MSDEWTGKACSCPAPLAAQDVSAQVSNSWSPCPPPLEQKQRLDIAALISSLINLTSVQSEHTFLLIVLAKSIGFISNEEQSCYADRPSSAHCRVGILVGLIGLSLIPCLSPIAIMQLLSHTLHFSLNSCPRIGERT